MRIRDELIGKIVLGRYRVVRRLARGGMGVVYLGRAEGAAGFVKPVVIKRMLTEIADDAMERMFVREARILSRLQHPNIVGVLDFGQEDGAYLLVMEYVHGYHLGRWERYVRQTRGPLPAPLAIHLAIHVLDALHYAHTRKRQDGEPLGIVHRDVSPSNVFLDAEGQVKLLDFGIARASGDTDEYKTQDTTVKGKLAYLPPEMFHGTVPTAQTDIYSCGVLLHELLIGKNEFRGAEMSDTLHLVLTHQPTPVHTVRDDVPAELDAILARALAKEPAERFEDADRFAQALREVRGLGEDEADSMLAGQVAQDFHGGLPRELDVPSLDELEESWRNPPTVEDHAESAPPPERRSVSDHPTRALGPGAYGYADGAPDAGGRRRAPGWALALGVVLAAGAGAAALALQEGKAREQPSVVVIQQGRTDDGTGASPGGASDGEQANDDEVAAAPDTGEPAVAAGADAGRAAPDEAGRRGRSNGGRVQRAANPADALSAAFERQSGRIQACFAQHTQGLTGAPQISVRFSIDTRGRVQSAQLVPSDLGQTPLGQCLLQVARATEFGPREQPATFRIPIIARRAG